jgi:hypothetical protein
MGRRLLRREGKLVFRLIAYESKRGRAFGNLIIPKETVIPYLPKTALSVMGTFFDAKTQQTIATEAQRLRSGSLQRITLLKSSHVILKPDTVRKMVFG